MDIKKQFHNFIDSLAKKEMNIFLSKIDSYKIISTSIFLDINKDKLLELGLNSDIQYSCSYEYSYSSRAYILKLNPHYKYQRIDINSNYSLYNQLKECILQNTNEPRFGSDVIKKYKRLDKIIKLKEICLKK